MIDTFQVATNGIGPGWTPFQMAVQGFGFEIEIIIRPSQGGGGYVGGIQQPYEVVIKIKYKGRTWEEKRFVSALMGKSLEKVLSSFKRMRVSSIEIVANINNIIRQKITIFAKRK